jgi:hypothetical protein
LKTDNQKLKKLYSLAEQLRDLSPWRWMYESDVFGVESPVSGELYFVSIMGSEGTFPAVMVYEGKNALDWFVTVQESETAPRPEDIFLIPHLMLSFEDREALKPGERRRLKDLGFSFRGRGAWPVLRRIIPGHPPVFPDASKLDDMIPVLEQTLHIARRAQKEEPPFISIHEQGYTVFFRACEPGSRAAWRDENRLVQPEFKPVPVRFSLEAVAELNRFPKADHILEVDLPLLPTPIKDREPAYFPFVFFVVDGHSGYILHFELLSPHPSVEDMFASCGQLLLEVLIKHKIRPLEIRVRSRRLYPLFEKVLANTSIRLVFSPELPAVGEAFDSMADFLGQR